MLFLGSPDSLLPASTPSIISPAQSYRWEHDQAKREKIDYDEEGERSYPVQKVHWTLHFQIRLLIMMAFHFKYQG